MDAILQNNIEKSNAHRENREQNAHYVLNNQELFADFLSLAFNTKDKNHYKACWILELVLEKKLELLFPFLDEFCEKLKNYTNDSAIRSISKICMFLTKYHLKNEKSTVLLLTEKQSQLITEACFDWTIDEKGKVATRVYAIRTLYELGKNQKWIYPELQRILAEDYTKYSPAYKAVAREILKKIK